MEGDRFLIILFEYLDSAMPEGHSNYQLYEPTNTSFPLFLTCVYVSDPKNTS